jgi:hypothetical protein
MKGSLASILKNLVERAEQAPGVPQRATLGGALRIDVRIAGGVVQLQLSRQENPPSKLEWDTTLKRFPFPLPEKIEVKSTQYGGRFYLRAAWPIIKQATLPDLGDTHGH